MCSIKGIPNGFPCGLRDPCMMDVARHLESVKILEPHACVFLRFPKVKQHPKCMDHAMLLGKPFGNHSSSARVIVSVLFFFAQDLFSHATTLNSDQSRQIVDACDYLSLSYWRSKAYSTSCNSCWRSVAHSTSCSRAIILFTLRSEDCTYSVLFNLYTKSIIIVDFNMRTRSSICECMLFTRYSIKTQK